MSQWEHGDMPATTSCVLPEIQQIMRAKIKLQERSHMLICCCNIVHVKNEAKVTQSLLTVVGQLPLIGPGADGWLVGCCDDSRLAKSGEFGADFDDARTAGRALLRGEETTSYIG